MVRRKRRIKKKVKWGSIGAPGSAKRKRHMGKIRRTTRRKVAKVRRRVIRKRTPIRKLKRRPIAKRIARGIARGIVGGTPIFVGIRIAKHIHRKMR